MELWAVWVILAMVALLIEIFTAGFAATCFTIGGLVAAVGAWFGVSGVVQLLLFSVATAVAFVVVRPLILKLFPKSGVLTNVEALVGRRAVVSSTIRNGEGRVTLDGDDWRAEIEDLECVLEIGVKVEVVRVESVILIVKKV